MARIETVYRRAFLVQVAIFLVFTLILVPLSAEARASWVHFALNMAVRLSIVLAFVAVTPRILGDNALGDRITPAPDPPPAPLEPAPAAGDAEPLPPRPTPRRTPAFWALLSVGTAVFLAGFIRQITVQSPIRFTLGGVLSLIGDLLYAFCFGFLAICSVLTFTAWLRRPATLTRTERLRRRAIDITVILAIASGCWLYHTPWWDRFLDWGIGIFCWSCFFILWMPKPSPQPELLHIVPADAPRTGTR